MPILIFYQIKKQSNETAVAFFFLLFLFEFGTGLQHLSNDLRENKVQVILTQCTASEKSMASRFNFGFHLISKEYYDRVGKDDWPATNVDEVLLLLKQIAFGAYEVLDSVWIAFLNFWQPLIEGMIERLRIDEGKADEEDVSVRVREGSQAFVFILTSSVPQPQFDEVALVFDGCQVVVKDGGNVVIGKGI